MTDPVDREPDPAGSSIEADVAQLRARVDRLERQLTQLVTTLSTRLTDHGRRLDRLDEPPQRRPGHEGEERSPFPTPSDPFR